MNIILGASGQVGSAIVDFLIDEGEPVKGVIRDKKKAGKFKEKTAEVSIANYFDAEALKPALKDGDTIFVLTPESPTSEDIMGDTRKLLENYRSAIESSKVKKVVGLSSMGAQHSSGTGNLQMSYMLEQAFTDLPVQKVFVRPAYYFSNWLPYLSMVEEQGVLPTFFPVELEIPMISPLDVAEFLAKVISDESTDSKIFEVTGAKTYSSKDIADILSEVLDRDVEAQQIPRSTWKVTILQFGFTENTAENLIEMIEAVIDGKTLPEKEDAVIELPTTFHSYLTGQINGSI